VDLYSFSKPNAPWYAWEWLTDVLDGSLHRVAGLKGIVLLAAVLIGLFALSLVRRMVSRDTHLFVALVVALLSVGGSSIHFLARPHLMTLLLLSISIWVIEEDRKHASSTIWWLVPLTAVWTNLHGGFLSVIVVLGLATVGSAIEAWFGSNGTIRDAVRYGKLTLACAAASLVNPYGWNLHKHVVEYLRSDWIRSVIQEFQSPVFRSENMLQFEALMLIGLIVAGAQFRRWKVVEGLWIVFWAHMALGSVRHAPIFVTVTAPIIASQLSDWWNTWTAHVKKSSLPGILNLMAADAIKGFRRTSAWPALAVAVLILLGPPMKWPHDFPEFVFPVKIVRAHSDLILKSRVLTTDQWADYLIYVNPAQKVFIDGRSDFYGPEVGNDYLRLTAGGWDWRPLLDKYRFNLALLPVESPLAQILKLAPDWRVIQDDGRRILLVRNPS
jgi:type IV secretory pathway VirB2 component (pilin)